MDPSFLQQSFRVEDPKPELAETKPCLAGMQLPSFSIMFPEYVNHSFNEEATSYLSSLDSGSPVPERTSTPSSTYKLVRNRINDEQSKSLWDLFRNNPYPNTNQRNKLANKLGLSARVVQVWFQNRRQSLKEK